MKRRVRSSVLFPSLFLLGMWAWYTPLIASLPSRDPATASDVHEAARIILWCIAIGLFLHFGTNVLKRRPQTIVRPVKLLSDRTLAQDLPGVFEFYTPAGNIMNGIVKDRCGNAALVCFWQPENLPHHAWVEEIVNGGEFECFHDEACMCYVQMPKDHYASLQKVRFVASA